MTRSKYSFVAAIVFAALMFPGVPALADRDDDREHPGQHKGWEKKHYGWQKKHDKKWHGSPKHGHRLVAAER